jgi:CheY-like chemotaxis protein
MSYLLTASGHQVIEAHDGLAGIGLAPRERPDLILLDIHMPRMDGYEVARQLRADAECSRIPLVAVTALAMLGDREKILAAGFSGYIAKPLDPEVFPLQVQGFLAPSSQSAASIAVPPRLHTPSAHTSDSSPAKLGLVLFVDNSQTNIELVRSILEPSGYEVAAALSAREGFEMAQRVRPDLIVSDVHMPHQDGYDFMRMLQADTTLCRIPLVFLSSSVWSLQERQRALSQGARKFIARPVEPKVLLSELQECLHRG